MQRVKNTIACEACRKRKSKYSNTAPCTACQKNGLLCEFKMERQRRGPRPRAKDPSPIDIDTPTAHSGSTPPATDPPVPAESQEEHDTIVLAMWSSCREDLRAIIDMTHTRREIAESMPEDTLLDVLCHLLELFWTHVHNQQWPILSPRVLYQAIKSRKCPPFLCLAICAASHRFSSHPALRKAHGYVSMDSKFASLARQRLYQLDQQNVARIQSLCILILYDAAMGRGSQAWADAAFARAAVDAMFNSPSKDADTSREIDTVKTVLIAHQHLHALGHPALFDPYRRRPSLSGDDDTSGAAIRLLSILLRVHEYSEFDSPQTYLPPWKSQSTFQQLWRELETFRLRNPDDIWPPTSLFQEIATPSNILAISLFSSLEWHCAVIILHRHLLAHISGWFHSTAMEAGPGPSLFATPSSSFMKEHMKIGISSALAVVDLCGQIMRCRSFFLPPFLAYTCFQSAIFLINALRCGLPDSDAKLQQILKFNFAVLVMSRDIYAPADTWIQTLEILRKAPIYPQGGYITRIAEPAFLPLDSYPDDEAHQAPTAQQPVPRQSGNLGPRHNGASPPAADQTDDGSNLLLDYQSRLDEDLLEEDAAPCQTQTQPQPLDEAPSQRYGPAHAYDYTYQNQSQSQNHHPVEEDPPLLDFGRGPPSATTTAAFPMTPHSASAVATAIGTSTIPVPHENQLISSLPAGLLDAAFSDPSAGAGGFDYGVIDSQILDMLLLGQMGTLNGSGGGGGGSSLDDEEENVVDLDGMQMQIQLSMPCVRRGSGGG